MAAMIYQYLAKNDYVNYDHGITGAYHDARREDTLATLPPELARYTDQILRLIDTVSVTARFPAPTMSARSNRKIA